MSKSRKDRLQRVQSMRRMYERYRKERRTEIWIYSRKNRKRRRLPMSKRKESNKIRERNGETKYKT